MSVELVILIAEALVVYLLVLGAHASRHRVGLSYFFALLGGITAVMSWVTDAGVVVRAGGITFMVGSTVFYTALLLGVFVVYVFDGPRATRIAITTVAGVSIMVPVIAMVLHFQMALTGHARLAYVPLPSLRINTASVVATIADLVFLAVAWEFLGKARGRFHGLWLRAFLTLLGVMWLDVLLFATGAFAGKPAYLSIMKGTLISRLVVSIFASPVLYGYLRWQSARSGMAIENRPVLAILREMAHVRTELSLAQREIERRKAAEKRNEELIHKLEQALTHVTHLEGLLPICSSCRKVRVETPAADGRSNVVKWIALEEYVRDNTPMRISHGICPDCLRRDFPNLAEDVLRDAGEPSSASPTQT